MAVAPAPAASLVPGSGFESGSQSGSGSQAGHNPVEAAAPSSYGNGLTAFSTMVVASVAGITLF